MSSSAGLSSASSSSDSFSAASLSSAFFGLLFALGRFLHRFEPERLLPGLHPLGLQAFRQSARGVIPVDPRLCGQDIGRGLMGRFQPPVCQRCPHSLLEGREFLDDVFIPIGEIQGVGPPARAHEDAGQCVVVRLGDGVQLVVVAARAGHGHGLKRLGEGVDLVVHHLLVDAVEHHAVPVTLLAHHVEHGTDERLVDLLVGVDSRGFHHVARDLLPHELIEGQVVVEGADQIVAESPGALGRDVPLVAVGVAVPHHVHPVTRPALAEMGGFEQTVHQALIGAVVRVVDKGLDLFGGRRQTGQHQAQAPDQRAPFRPGSRLQPFLLQLGQDEAVHGEIRPAFVLDLRQRRLNHRLETPPAAPLLEDFFPRLVRHVRGFGCRGRVARVGRSQQDPLFEVIDDPGRQLRPAQGHGGSRAVVPEGSNQGTPVRIARDQRRSRLAALLPSAPVIEAQAPHGLGFAVTTLTALDQDGTDSLLEELQLLRTDILLGAFRSPSERSGADHRQGGNGQEGFWHPNCEAFHRRGSPPGHEQPYRFRIPRLDSWENPSPLPPESGPWSGEIPSAPVPPRPGPGPQGRNCRRCELPWRSGPVGGSDG